MDKLNTLILNENPKIDIRGRVCHHRTEILYGLTELYNLQNYLE